ncbi:MAG: hypothetical protein HQ567_09505, partial [Candidatus Nealsonbacteria bacterium]|nr:hypothetical protein [Candidatus Nealsonbacteria bacterium]
RCRWGRWCWGGCGWLRRRGLHGGRLRRRNRLLWDGLLRDGLLWNRLLWDRLSRDWLLWNWLLRNWLLRNRRLQRRGRLHWGLRCCGDRWW